MNEKKNCFNVQTINVHTNMEKWKNNVTYRYFKWDIYKNKLLFIFHAFYRVLPFNAFINCIFVVLTDGSIAGRCVVVV